MMNAPDEPTRRALRQQEIREWCQEWQSMTGYKRIVAPKREGMRYRCPCCFYKTLPERGHWDICPVCFWEDDGQDDEEAYRHSGPNKGATLLQARYNYRTFGASLEHRLPLVRSPLLEEF